MKKILVILLIIAGFCLAGYLDKQQYKEDHADPYDHYYENK